MSPRRVLLPFLFFALALLVAGYALEMDRDAALASLTSQSEGLVAREVARLESAFDAGRVKIDGDDFESTMVRLGANPALAYVLLDRNGRVQASQGAPKIAQDRADALMGRADGTHPVRLDGQVYGLAPAGHGQTVLVLADVTTAVAGLNDAFKARWVRVAGLALALSAILSLVLYLVNDRRLGRVARAIQGFTEGDGSVRVGLFGWDPVARLGRLVDDMAARIGRERANLAESEERLKFALHGSHAGIWDWRIDTGHTYYSPRWKSLLGFSEHEVLPHSEEWLKRVHPDDLANVMARLNAHMTGPSPFFESEHRLRNKEGDYIWVMERGVVLHDGDGKAYRMVGALTDISLRKEVESALQRSEEAYRSVVNAVSQVIFRCDAEGRLTFLNPAWTELTGHGIDSSLRRRLTEFVHGEDRAWVSRLFGGVTDAGSEDLSIISLRLTTRSGGVRWFSLHARALPSEPDGAGTAGLLTDIDALKKAQDALLQSNRERNTILDLSPDGFVFFDENERVVYVNPAFSAMTGIARAAIEGQSLAELHKEVLVLLDPAQPAPDLAGHPDDARTVLNLVKPAKLVLALLTRYIRDPRGGLLAGILYLRDVTTQVEIDRMKNEFLSTAAHELRTPMASIFGFSELLLVRDFDEATRRDLLQRIHRQTKNLINLVNELLDLARIEARGGKSFKFKQVDLATVVQSALNAFYVPQETHTLSVDVPAELGLVHVDPDKLQQVIANVLGNALKYSPDGGEIAVAARRRTGEDGRQYLGISVRDQGIGMTADQVARVFDRFYRADTSGSIPGTGLGMCLVKEVMGVLEGEVAIDSRPGEGTEVVLWLPEVAAPAGTGQKEGGGT